MIGYPLRSRINVDMLRETEPVAFVCFDIPVWPLWHVFLRSDASQIGAHASRRRKVHSHSADEQVNVTGRKETGKSTELCGCNVAVAGSMSTAIGHKKLPGDEVHLQAVFVNVWVAVESSTAVAVRSGCAGRTTQA